jgi:hypothetical protein
MKMIRADSEEFFVIKEIACFRMIHIILLRFHASYS